MSDSSDEDYFTLPETTRSVRAKKTADPSKGFSIDDLLEEAKVSAAIARKVELNPIESFKPDQAFVDENPDDLFTLSKAMQKEEEIMWDNSLEIHGTIRTLRPSLCASIPDLSFEEEACLQPELGVLYRALSIAGQDHDDLVEIFNGVLVIWLKEKDLHAPSEVCRWILRTVAYHDNPLVAAAAQSCLMDLLDMSQDWRLSYRDASSGFRANGGVWLFSCRESDEEDDDGEKKVTDGFSLGLFLEVVEACLRKGKHKLSDSELKELLLDLCSAGLDTGACLSCARQISTTEEATVNAMSVEFLKDKEAFSSLVKGIYNLEGRGIAPMSPASLVLLARGVPIRPYSDGVGPVHHVPLRSELCHLILSRRLLAGTMYTKEEAEQPGFPRALKALKVMANGDERVMTNSLEAYESQYAIIAIADLIMGSSLVEEGRTVPQGHHCRELLQTVKVVQRELKQVMQPAVQRAKGLLETINSKYSPHLPSGKGLQTLLPGGGSGECNGNCLEGEVEGGLEEEGEDDSSSCHESGGEI